LKTKPKKKQKTSLNPLKLENNSKKKFEKIKKNKKGIYIFLVKYPRGNNILPPVKPPIKNFYKNI
jgi:hypothetical protein